MVETHWGRSSGVAEWTEHTRFRSVPIYRLLKDAGNANRNLGDSAEPQLGSPSHSATPELLQLLNSSPKSSFNPGNSQPVMTFNTDLLKNDCLQPRIGCDHCVESAGGSG